MGILGIKNRTENWKTARTFAPFYTDVDARVALAQELGESESTSSHDIQIELFWKGMRDYIHVLDEKYKPTRNDIAKRHEYLAERYNRLFPTLRSDIEKSTSKKCLKSHNYNPKDKENDLYQNLRNTEIDIVLVTPRRLYIGEAKDESRLNVKYGYVLMHQLIRQYVMTRILLDWLEYDREIVPFVIGDDPVKLKEPHPKLEHIHQISFMIDQGWLKEENVLSWNCIDEIAKSTPADS